MKCEKASGNLLSKMAKFSLAAAWVTAGLGQMLCCFIPAIFADSGGCFLKYYTFPSLSVNP